MKLFDNILTEALDELDFDRKIYKKINNFDDPKYADDARWDEEGAEDTERQRQGSEKTSRPQVPYTFRREKGLTWTRGHHNLDIGGGEFDFGTNELKNREGVINLVFDPYNRHSDFNNATLDKVEELGGADSVTVNSCLNVIQGRKFIEQVIMQAAKALKPEGVAVFKIHPGDTKKGIRKSGDGIPRNTSSGYQQFKRAKKYIPLIHQYFEEVYLDNGHDCIIAKKSLLSLDTQVPFYPDKDGKPRYLNLQRENRYLSKQNFKKNR